MVSGMTHWLDITLLIILILSFAYSIIKGFVKEVFSLLSILFASIIATHYCKLGEFYLRGIVENKNVAHVIGFVVLFLITAVLVRLLGMAINKFIKTVGLSIPNRLLGGLLGFIKGVILFSVLLLIITTFSKNGANTISKANAAHYFLPISQFIGDFLPQDLSGRSKRDYRKLRKLIEEAGKEKIQNAIEEDKEKLQEILQEHL